MRAAVKRGSDRRSDTRIQKAEVREHDPVNHPSHYTSDPSGVECIDVIEHRTLNIGNAIKYLWRVGLKGDPIEDLEKSSWYIAREIKRIKKLRDRKKGGRR